MNLTVKIAGGLVGVALLALVLPGYLLIVGVSERTAELEAMDLRDLRDRLQWHENAVEERLRQSVVRMARTVAQDPVFRSGVPDISSQAERGVGLMSDAGLDLLWVVDPSGTILSAGHWPETAGARRQELLRLLPGHATVIRAQVPGEKWLALLVSETVPLAGGKLILVGGLRLASVVRNWPGAEGDLAVALLAPDTRLEAARPWPFPVSDWPPAMAAQLAGGESIGAEVTGTRGQPWLAATLPLLGDGAAQGNLVAVRTLEPLRVWQRRFLLSLLLVGLTAVVLAAAVGTVVARRISRPLRELTAVTARMSAGDLDLALPVRSADEVGRLTAAFNSMAVSLREGRVRLARTERLAAWRDAARRMAHEVKNPLAPIRMSVDNLRKARATSAATFDRYFAEECRTIVEEVDALHRLVDEFSRFARLPEPHTCPTQVAGIVQHVVDLYGPSVTGARLRCRVPPDLPSIDVDPGLIGQVLKNLVGNALDAVPHPGGEVVMECEARDGSVIVAVSDNGPGVPPAVRDHLFEPQVTTKAGGSGLGLAISKQIVDRHGGRIDVETGESGTTFTVWLPIQASNPGPDG